MNILLLLIPISLVFVGVGAVAFFWAVNHRQFDELDAAALLPMADGDAPAAPGPASRGGSKGPEPAGPGRVTAAAGREGV